MAAPVTTPTLSWQDFYETTLSANIVASDTTIPLTSVPSGTEGFLVIDPNTPASREIIYFNSKTGSAVLCPNASTGRGQGGTTAASHLSGVTVRMAANAQSFSELQNGNALGTASIVASKLATNSVTSAKLSANLAGGWRTTDTSGTTLPTPNTVTYNGNRSYSLVFNSTDLTSYISPGMRLKMTRTVTAPTQCTSLNGTTQYYTKTSPSGVTFTDTPTLMAWVKLSSYAAGIIVSRKATGTAAGWELGVNATGQVQIRAGNTAANLDDMTTTASLPLNRWVHVAAVLTMSTSGSTFIYFDGVSMPGTFTNGTSTTITQSGTLSVGANNDGTNFFPGKLAQVAIFSAALSSATILSYISQGLAGTETSLVSAYSFNNSKNDLNTTNANNLTANGSAVETNADSPFAGGSAASTAYTAGTTEFVEVTGITFSTNTTITAQTPIGYAVPTSGGISAVAYATSRAALGTPTSLNMPRLFQSGDLAGTTSGTTELEIGRVSIPSLPYDSSVLLQAAYSISAGSAAPSYTVRHRLRLTSTSGTLLQEQNIVKNDPNTESQQWQVSHNYIYNLPANTAQDFLVCMAVPSGAAGPTVNSTSGKLTALVLPITL